jgi:hypothetical protein
LDEAEWIFEVLINAKYHFVRRRNPDRYDGKEDAGFCNLLVQAYTEQN